MTKNEIVEAINQASEAWEYDASTGLDWKETMDDRYEAMKALFIPVFNYIKSDVDFRSFVPWYHNYFSVAKEVNDDIVVKFMTMTAAVHDC